MEIREHLSKRESLSLIELLTKQRHASNNVIKSIFLTTSSKNGQQPKRFPPRTRTVSKARVARRSALPHLPYGHQRAHSWREGGREESEREAQRLVQTPVASHPDDFITFPLSSWPSPSRRRPTLYLRLHHIQERASLAEDDVQQRRHFQRYKHWWRSRDTLAGPAAAETLQGLKSHLSKW